jgi:hypothetical protein
VSELPQMPQDSFSVGERYHASEILSQLQEERGIARFSGFRRTDHHLLLIVESALDNGPDVFSTICSALNSCLYRE